MTATTRASAGEIAGDTVLPWLTAPSKTTGKADTLTGSVACAESAFRTSMSVSVRACGDAARYRRVAIFSEVGKVGLISGWFLWRSCGNLFAGDRCKLAYFCTLPCEAGHQTFIADCCCPLWPKLWVEQLEFLGHLEQLNAFQCHRPNERF